MSASSGSVNPAVQALLAEIAVAKLRAEQRRQAKAEADQQPYGVIKETSGALVLRLPPPPPAPAPSDCCHSGCTPCILDTYRDHLHAHNAEVAALQAQYQCALLDDTGPLPEPRHHVLSHSLLNPLRFAAVRIIHAHSIGARGRLLVLEATAADFALAPGEHIHVRAQPGAVTKPITKPFTPVMIVAADGIVRPHLFVRLYADHAMSAYLANLSSGDQLAVRGPVSTPENMTRALSAPLCLLAAGGSGIAPIFQLLQFAHANCAYRQTRIVLVHCAQDSESLWLRAQVAEMMVDMPALEYVAFLSEQPEQPEQLEALELRMVSARMSLDGIRRAVGGNVGAKAQAVVCGPGSFNQDVARWLTELGFAGIQTL